MTNKCPIHPDYKAIYPPRSTKPGCVCRQIWNDKNRLKAELPTRVRSGRELLTW